jgi:hypothetical protein
MSYFKRDRNIRYELLQESLPRVVLLLTLIVVIILVACAVVVSVFAAPQGELLLQEMYLIDDVGYYVSENMFSCVFQAFDCLANQKSIKY